MASKSRALFLVLASGLLLGAECDPPYLEPPSPRALVALDDGWRFVRADVPAAAAAGFDDGAWSKVRLPHTWNARDGQDGGNDYYRGPGWYRRKLKVPRELRGQRLYLQFDGAALVTDVWLNGTHVGQHRGGFGRFRFDVTRLVREGENQLAVRVDNGLHPDVSPIAGDFTFFGGLYRRVHLLATDPVHIDVEDFGSAGVYLTPRAVSAASASLDARVKLANDTGEPQQVSVDLVVVRADRSVLTILRGETQLEPHARGEVRLTGAIDSPRLWDGPTDPYLYRAYAEIRAGGAVRDVVAQPLGFRDVAITATGGLVLNGRPVEVRGVIKHQDRQDRGWAVDPAHHREDIDLITEMGANAVRLAHYQQAEEVHALCDRAGLLVWSELGLVNAVVPSPAFHANARQQLKELIRQSYNHPSIIVWGLANEVIDYDAAAPYPFITELGELAHAEDPLRPTTLASHLPEAFALNDQADLIGFNKYFGWYYGTTADLGPFLDKLHERYPGRRLAMSEYGAGGSLTLHSATPRAGDHTEGYQARYHEESWRALAARPFLWGRFITFMFDVGSDARNEGDRPGRNDKGLVSYDRQTRKDAFYFYKAAWSRAPFVHVTGRRFEPRVLGPLTEPGTIEVKVYSNASSVSLTVNGDPVGSQTGERVFVFPSVPLQAGANLIEAIAVVDGHTVRDAVTLTRVDPASAPPAPAPVGLSGPCSDLTPDGSPLSLPTPKATPPATTGGLIADGDYLLTSGLNAMATGQVLSKMRVRNGGLVLEALEKFEPHPVRTAAGNLLTYGDTLIRNFICPGPATQVQRYTATPTTLTIVNSNGIVGFWTRQ